MVASNLILPLDIVQGKTFTKTIRWEKEPFIYVPIAAVVQQAPVQITTTDVHNLPDGWRVAVVSVLGMTQLNAKNAPPRGKDFVRCTVIDPTTIQLNTVNAAGYDAYESGGYLQFYTPASLYLCTARLVIKDAPGGTELLRLTDTDGITLDDEEKTVTFVIDAVTAADMAASSGVYELEIEDGDGVVTGLCSGPVNVTEEVAT